MSGFIIALIVFALVVVMWFIGESNRLNRYQVMIEESKRTVDTPWLNATTPFRKC